MAAGHHHDFLAGCVPAGADRSAVGTVGAIVIIRWSLGLLHDTADEVRRRIGEDPRLAHLIVEIA